MAQAAYVVGLAMILLVEREEDLVLPLPPDDQSRRAAGKTALIQGTVRPVTDSEDLRTIPRSGADVTAVSGFASFRGLVVRDHEHADGVRLGCDGLRPSVHVF
eukprot:SAG25_NODE_8113_length_439_cov_1.067647_1_plen_102_part_01